MPVRLFVNAYHLDSYLAGFNVTSVEGEDLLDALAKLHERLNAVGMPRVYQSGGEGSEFATTAKVPYLEKYFAEHGHYPVVSC